MSLSNKEIYTASKIVKFYTEKLRGFGDSPQGVGWKDGRAQLIRVEQLVKVIRHENDFSINDLECGSGRSYKYLLSENYAPSCYRGYEILEEMLLSAKENLPPDAMVALTKIESPLEMVLSDYIVASGIFNVKYEAELQAWLNHILITTHAMHEKSNVGFAFNLLTNYSDKEYMQAYLYHADPLFLFDYCKNNFSKNVALLHDYFQYDFTIVVRKD